MEIEEGKTFGKLSLEFTDANGIKCDLWIDENSENLYCNIGDDLAIFTQEDIKALLPYLQSFAETGQLEPQSPLQGGDAAEMRQKTLVSLQEQLDKAKKEASYYRRQCDQYVDQVANLEDLIEDWRNIVERNLGGNKLNEVQKRTIQILGEDHD